MTSDISGFTFPFHFDPARGGVASESGAEKLKQNLIHLLLTGVGERVMRRDYGGGLQQLIHDPNNDALRAITQHQIAKSIGRWEPRVLLQSVTITEQGATLIAEIRYVVRSTGQRESLSVPIGLGGI